jgi:carboxyl-terminal processing protease
MPRFARLRHAASAGFAALLALSLAACRGNAASGEAETKADAAADDAAAGEAPTVTPPDLSQHAFPLLVWSAFEVDTDYFDRTRIDPRGQLVAAARALGEHTPEFFAEVSADTLRVRVRSSVEEFSIADVTTLVGAATRLEEVLTFTQSILDLEPAPLHELEYAAVNGLLGPLDSHTVLLTPEQHTELGVKTRGEFGGVGAQIRVAGRRIVIVDVLPGLPAEKAGLAAGDIILTIDGESTVNLAAEEAQQKLRGPVGTIVVLELERDGKKLRVEVTRDTIRIDSVRMVELPGRVAHLAIAQFQEATAQEARDALAKVREPTGVILDLRGNSGGVLTQAGELIDAFVPRGELVVVRTAAGDDVAQAEAEVALPTSVPVVVMVDEDAASAAEIVAGGLQALGRATVVGRTTFGKGTVQMVRAVAPYGQELALKLTVAEWLVAGGRKIQTAGVVPDLELVPVEPTGVPGVVRYFDEERFESARERARVAHLPSAKYETMTGVASAPRLSMHYLAVGAVPASITPDPGTTLPRELGDPEIRLAFEVARGLVAAGDDAAKRTAALDEATRRLTADEEARITAALGEQGVDWAPATAGAPSSGLGITASVVGKQPIVAGAPFELRIEVTNTGTTELHRVHLVSECLQEELDALEVMIGRMKPGAKEQRTLKLQVFPWQGDLTDVIRIDAHVGAPDGPADASAQTRLEIAQTTKPALSYEYWIVDDPARAEAAPPRPKQEGGAPAAPLAIVGNGDGVLQPGETVLVSFTAHNDGPGASDDVRAIIRNLSGRQGLLEEGFYELGPLGVGASRSGSFGITLSPQADPALPLELELIVGDAGLRTMTQDRLRFRVLSEAPAMTPVKKKVQVGATTARLYAGAHASSSVVATAPAGAVLDVVGEQGGFLVVDGGGLGRRMYLPADLEGLGDATGPGKASLLRRVQVLPPRIELDALPRVTKATSIKITGTIHHPERSRDVAVLLRPPGSGRADRKVFYAANDANDGAAARALAFTTTVELEPGSNRISVLARDGAKIMARRDVWVFRE